MHHKLQNFQPKNDVQNSVVRNDNSLSQPEIASNDAGSACATQPKSPVAQRPSAVALSCEVARSDGYDPTGENAVACGAQAQFLCEYCGPICSSCAEETFCLQGEHKLSPLPEADPAPHSKLKRPVNQVVYVEIKCPNCRRVRLALPKKHRPKARRKCPICKKEAPAEYLAHGFTRRRLPYHELFEIPDPKKETVLPDGKRRVPWDTRDLTDRCEE
jgi:hypothetical protein